MEVCFIISRIEANYCLGEVHKLIATHGVVEVDWAYNIVYTVRVGGKESRSFRIARSGSSCCI
jgi:hypothetical protein